MPHLLSREHLHLSWERTGAGDGAEPLVLLHGLGSTREDFAALRPRLAREFDVFLVDLPGHGRSRPAPVKPTVAAVTDCFEADLDALGLDRVHLLGNSLGGRIALELAVRHRARSVVALAPSGLATSPERFYEGMILSGARLVLRTMTPLITPLSKLASGRAFLLAGLRAHPAKASPEEARAVEGGFAGARGYWRMLWWSVLTDVPTRLAGIDCPVILAQGTADLIAAGQAPRFLLAVPGSVFRPLPSAGHAPQSDSPDEIIALVHEAVRRSEARPSSIDPVTPA